MIYNTITNLSKILIIIGGIAWGIYGCAKINIFKRITLNENILKFIYIIIGLSSIYLMFNRNFYLPFLGKTVVPFSLMKKQKIPKDSSVSVQVNVPPYSRVIYWAAEPLQENQTTERCVRVAYGTFENSGITTADETGKAQLILRMPAGYTIKKCLLDKRLPSHVHYRYSLSDGMLSEIYTKNITSVNSNMNDALVNNIVTKFDNAALSLANKNTVQATSLSPVQQSIATVEAMTQEKNVKNNTLKYENDPSFFETFQSV
jgi:hypothetical protein